MIRESHRFPGAVIYEHGNCGYPTIGALRRISPTIVGVSHITGNSELPSALAEMKYSARQGSGASFPFAVNRNGTVVQGFDPFKYAPWTNGDLRDPDTSNPYIRAMVGSRFNANEFCLITIENVGFERELGRPAPLTDAQIETNAAIYAWAAAVRGATRIELDVVIGHRMINSISRQNCPTRGDLLALRRRIVRRANEILNPVEEKNVILLPAELFPLGTRGHFTKDVDYDLYRIDAGGDLDRKVWTPRDDRNADLGGRVMLDGDANHLGLLITSGDQAGWIVSGYGNQPSIVPPTNPEVETLKATISDQAALISRLRDIVAAKRALGDQVTALGQQVSQ